MRKLIFLTVPALVLVSLLSGCGGSDRVAYRQDYGGYSNYSEVRTEYVPGTARSFDTANNAPFGNVPVNTSVTVRTG
jgi:hypothetical protein